MSTLDETATKPSGFSSSWLHLCSPDTEYTTATTNEQPPGTANEQPTTATELTEVLVKGYQQDPDATKLGGNSV